MSKRTFKTHTGLFTTGIGSLPFSDIDEAIDYSFKHEIPYLPQLPKLCPSEFMIHKTLGNLVDQRDQKSSSHSNIAELIEGKFLQRLQSSPVETVKLQFCGPITAIAYLENQGEVIDASLLTKVEKCIVESVHQLTGKLSSTGVSSIVFLDEPGVNRVTHIFKEYGINLWDGLSRVLAAIRGSGVKTGVHCCCECDWGSLLDRRMDYLSFDMGLSIQSLFSSRRQLHGHLKRGGQLSLGVIPTDPTRLDHIDLVSDLIKRLKEYSDIGDVFDYRQALITPVCGLFGLSRAQTYACLDNLEEAKLMLGRGLGRS